MVITCRSAFHIPAIRPMASLGLPLVLLFLLLVGVRGIDDFTQRTCDPKLFTDPSEYFMDVRRKVEALQTGDELMISGWKFNLDFTFDPCTGNNTGITLRKLLRDTAEKGVDVYVQLWWSAGSHTTLEFFRKHNVGAVAAEMDKLHQNIHTCLGGFGSQRVGDCKVVVAHESGGS